MPDTKENSEAERHTGAKDEEPPEVSDLDKMQEGQQTCCTKEGQHDLSAWG